MKQYQDHYFHKAKQENYPARSVYKLRELDTRFMLFHKRMKVLDLGAAPGSWTLYAAQCVGEQGKVLSCDMQNIHIKLPEHVVLCIEDIFHPSEIFEKILKDIGPFHIVMSDMAPKTTGIKFVDQVRSLDLSQEALALAKDNLLQDGSFIVKVFMGPDVIELVKSMKQYFNKVSLFKPKSSRAESKEIFYLGQGFNKNLI